MRIQWKYHVRKPWTWSKVLTIALLLAFLLALLAIGIAASYIFNVAVGAS